MDEIMARQINRLSPVAVKNATKRGFYADGGGLYLQVSPSGSKSWVYRFTLDKRKRDMGLGPYPLISLADARMQAEKCRRLRYEGIDPIEKRNEQKRQSRLETAKTVTFRFCANEYIRLNRAGWRNPRQAKQWESSLRTYAFPVLGDLPVDKIDIGLVLRVLEPIWQTKAETASRVRGRIESVLDWAKARKFREGENPARWKGNLSMVLPSKKKVAKVVHHPALPYTEVSDFISDLRKRDGLSALGLELVILTACRTGEIIKAKWSEFDLDKKLWTIPADHMKSGREHRVPLSEPALDVLKELKEHSRNDFVLPGNGNKGGSSNMIFLQLLRRMGRSDITAHGFRSTFRDWAAEKTDYQNEVAEMALSHAVGDRVEAAYRRGDMFEKRQQLMDDWAMYCIGLGKE
ncbi:tyrosine-type recombinase/integrase [Sneathiella chungangensis]|nr:site-specific integrase [Sneathiella chungangensis]